MRCFPHAVTALATAQQRRNAAAQTLESAERDGTPAQRQLARHDLDRANTKVTQALIGYASTERGRSELLAKLDATTDAHQAAQLQRVIDEGAQHRRRAEQAYAEWRHAHQDTGGPHALAADSPASPAAAETPPTDSQCGKCGQFAGPDHTCPAAAGRVSFADMDRDTRVEAMRSEIDEALSRMSSAEGWQRFLTQASQFHSYSLNNQLLISMQRPDATLVAGRTAWMDKHERHLVKGAKAIWVYAPMLRKETLVDPGTGEEKVTRRIYGFKPVPVYDVSDTDGKPLLTEPGIKREALVGEAPDGMIESLTDTINGKGFTVSYEPLQPGHGGYTDFRGQRVVVNSNLGSRERARTLAHEAAHIELGHGEEIAEYHTRPGGKRPDMEVEAESTAYVVARAWGIDEIGNASFNYIDGWAAGDVNRVKATAEKVVTAAKSLLATATPGGRVPAET